MTGQIMDKMTKGKTTLAKSFIWLGFLLHAFLRTTFFLFFATPYLIGQAGSSSTTSGQSAVQSAAPKGSRSLSIDCSMPEDNNYDHVFKLAQNAGMSDIGLSLDWRDIEVHPKVYRNPYLKIANDYYPPKKVTLDLTIRPLHNNRKSVPDDLALVAFSDEQMISRFQAMMDYVFSQTDKLTFSSIAIGSEFDVYLKKDATLWKQYTVFCKSVANYLRTRKPGLRIGFEATYPGLVGSSKQELKSLNQFSDVIGVSYYPIEADFSVKDPVIVKNDFKALTSIYPNQKLFFYQLGYPSSTVLNSSEEKQAKFIEAVFAAWDAYAMNIGMIDFTFLTDVSPQGVKEQSQYFGLNQNRFSEFLGTLGLRRYPKSGEDKAAFLALRREAKARGW